MAVRMPDAEDQPRHHAAKMKCLLEQAARYAREDVDKVADPKAQALFETTAEVLDGLRSAYEHYEERSESAWQGKRA